MQAITARKNQHSLQHTASITSDGTDMMSGHVQLTDEAAKRAASSGVFAARLSAPASRLRDLEMEQWTGFVWSSRCLVLTASQIELARNKSEIISEVVQLQHIVRIDRPTYTDVAASFRAVRKPGVMEEEESLNKEFKDRVIMIEYREEDDELELRTMYLRTATIEQAAEFVVDLKTAIRRRTTAYQRFASRAKKLHDSVSYQTIMYLVIGLAFVVSVYEAEHNPVEDSQLDKTLEGIESAITYIFMVDLILLYVGESFISWTHFFHSGWNLFDLFVVAVSMVSEYSSDVPGLASLRLLRVFRVVKLLRSMTELRTTVNALAGSIVPLCHAFAIVTSEPIILKAEIDRNLFSLGNIKGR
mmetsp:Transcript_26449/g.41345  ORF Transcript_26449/g.41345 Transcript_26449/m.41345 type:complete len:359 (+) Transcript_26449:104-1180(+)